MTAPSHAHAPRAVQGVAAKMRVLDLFSGYTIREDGEVKSRSGKVIRHQFDGPGYARVELWQNGSGKKYLVHRLLAQAFIPNPDGKPQVNHIDGDKKNNDLSNLEWVTQSENQLHAYRIGLQVGYRKPGPISEAHKAALCGSRWNGTARTYHCGEIAFETPEDAAAHHGVSRQTVYNRAASARFPDWEIIVRREVK
jgi:hypothetical protein